VSKIEQRVNKKTPVPGRDERLLLNVDTRGATLIRQPFQKHTTRRWRRVVREEPASLIRRYGPTGRANLSLQDDTLSPGNGGVSGLYYSNTRRYLKPVFFRQATPGPIRRLRWYRAHSPRPDSLNLA